MSGSQHGGARGVIVVACLITFVLGGLAGGGVLYALTREPPVEVDPWDAFVPDDDWRDTSREALVDSADEVFGGAGYTYLLVDATADSAVYLLGQDSTYTHRVEVWRGRHDTTLRWAVVDVVGIDLDSRPVVVESHSAP